LAQAFSAHTSAHGLGAGSFSRPRVAPRWTEAGVPTDMAEMASSNLKVFSQLEVYSR